MNISTVITLSRIFPRGCERVVFSATNISLMHLLSPMHHAAAIDIDCLARHFARSRAA
jgi:hypothetical protein